MFFLTRAGVLRALGCVDLPPRVDDLLGAIGVGWGGGILRDLACVLYLVSRFGIGVIKIKNARCRQIRTRAVGSMVR